MAALDSNLLPLSTDGEGNFVGQRDDIMRSWRQVGEENIISRGIDTFSSNGMVTQGGFWPVLLGRFKIGPPDCGGAWVRLGVTWTPAGAMPGGAGVIGGVGIDNRGVILGSPFRNRSTYKGSRPSNDIFSHEICLNGEVKPLRSVCGNKLYSSIVGTAISPNGFITGVAARIKPKGKVAVMLLPFELLDTKDGIYDDQIPQGTVITESIRDVGIYPDNSVTQQRVNSTAWIEPHGSDDGANAPDMPKLSLRLRGTEQLGVKIKWKLKVQYKRPSGRILSEDTVNIPASSNPSGWVTESFDGAIEIFNHADWAGAIGQQSDPLQPGRGFFGGNAELSWHLLRSDESPLGLERKVHFRIAGKNPIDQICRSYIDTVVPSLITEAGSIMWYAYAIAKSETKNEGEPNSYYNQFLKRGAKYRDVRGSEGLPNWNNDGKGKPGGYGVKQVTGYQGNAMGNVPRSVIWNWRHNVDEGLRELSEINKEARAWMQTQRSRTSVLLPPHQVRHVIFQEGAMRVMDDAVAIKRYNGASRRGKPDSYTDVPGGFTFTNEIPQPKMGHYCYWDKPRNKWSLSRYNAYKKPFVYVDRVCLEVDP